MGEELAGRHAPDDDAAVGDRAGLGSSPDAGTRDERRGLRQLADLP
jgi:hypothetical protein